MPGTGTRERNVVERAVQLASAGGGPPHAVPPTVGGARATFVAKTGQHPAAFELMDRAGPTRKDATMACAVSSFTATHQIRFEPLSARAHALAFGCDASGRVDLDALGERARNDYLFARAMVGHRFAKPAVVPVAAH
jgi:hypothetical protein